MPWVPTGTAPLASGDAGRRKLPWLVTGVALVGIVGLLVYKANASHHPAPRTDDEAVLAMSVMPASAFGNDPRAANAYELAALVPGTLDGLYCYCHCKENAGHRSLLTCFQSRHAAACDVCMGEAELAYRLRAQGESLDAIRRAVDAEFGS